MRPDVAVLLGQQVLTVALAELAERNRAAGAVLLAGAVAATVAHARDLGPVVGGKYALVFAACGAWMFRHRVDTRGRVLCALLFANVAVMAIPPLYHRKFPFALSVLLLASATPTSYASPLFGNTYARAYAVVLGTYFLYCDPSRGNPLGALASVAPMGVGLATGSVTRSVAYRVMGMIVAVCANFLRPPLLGASRPPPPTPFRPAWPAARFTTLSDAALAATDRARHPWPYAAALGLNAAALAPLLAASHSAARKN